MKEPVEKPQYDIIIMLLSILLGFAAIGFAIIFCLAKGFKP